MSEPKLTDSNLLIDGEDMSADITSLAQDVSGVTISAFACTAPSNTHVGTIEFQVSPDGVTWSAKATHAVASGSALEHIEDVDSTGSKFMRVFYDATSGAGALTVKVSHHRISRG